MWQLTHLLTTTHAFLCCVSLEVPWKSLVRLDLGTYWGKQSFDRQVTAEGFNAMAGISSVPFGACFSQLRTVCFIK